MERRFYARSNDVYVAMSNRVAGRSPIGQRSHLTTHTHFLEHPTHIDGSFRDTEGWGWEIFSDQSPEPPREFIAKAGDVIFWHCFLCHTGSANFHDIPRFGLFARWSYREKERIRYEVPENLWKILDDLRMSQIQLRVAMILILALKHLLVR